MPRDSVSRMQPRVFCPCDFCGGRGFVPFGDGLTMTNCVRCKGRGLVSDKPPQALASWLCESHDILQLIERIAEASDNALALEGEAMASGDRYDLGLATGERCALASVVVALRMVVERSREETIGESVEVVRIA